jgi:hypothetical protein
MRRLIDSLPPAKSRAAQRLIRVQLPGLERCSRPFCLDPLAARSLESVQTGSLRPGSLMDRFHRVVLIAAALITAACGPGKPSTREEARQLLQEARVPVTEAQLIAQVQIAAAGPALKERAPVLETIRLLMMAGIGPDVLDQRSGKTALMLAAESGQLDVVQALLQGGAAVDASTAKAVEPFDFLMTVHNDVTFQARHEKYTALQFAAVAGHPEVTKALIAAGADHTVTDHWGHTVLNAVSRGRAPQRVEVAKALLAAGVGVDEPNLNGTTPLMTAAITGNAEVITLLLGAGADCSKKSRFGTTALEVARTTVRYSGGDYEGVIRALEAASCQ